MEEVNVRGLIFTDAEDGKAYKVFKESGSWAVAELNPEPVALALSLSAVTDDSIDLFGKKASDLQSNIVVGESGIAGNSHYVEGYTGFSSKVSEQSGHYIALKAVANKEGATLKMNNVALDSDGIQVVIVADNSKKVKVEAILGDEHVEKIFALTDLVLEVKEEPQVEA